MAQLDATDRGRVFRGLMRYWSKHHTADSSLTKTEFLAAVNATDTWIDDSAAAFNAALPTAARADLTAAQKALLFCAVALVRFTPGTTELLRRLLGGEVD